MNKQIHNISVEGFIEIFDRRYSTSIFNTLLCDRTTGRNIIWANNDYEALGDGYKGDDEITGTNCGVIKPRIAKEQGKKSQRTKSRAEVFTPSWLCNQMNNDIDEIWFGRRNIFNTETVSDDGVNTWTAIDDHIELPKVDGHGWKEYVESPRLEITCGEAPFICSRYDTVTGESIEVADRIGFLDRKLRVVSEHSISREIWFSWALAALKATYGYEYQGDNLLLARINVFETVCDHCADLWGGGLSEDEEQKIADVISWNLWQMDGLTRSVPTLSSSPLCLIYDWENEKPIEFASLG